MSENKMMKALKYSKFGGPEVLEFVDIPELLPGAGQVRVRVHAAGVNPRDGKLRSGSFASEPLKTPAGVGMEMSGVVDVVGPGVTLWQVGDPVFGLTATRDAIATHAIADADQLVYRPNWLDDVTAAALPIAVETAQRALRRLEVKAGETLLIHGAAGAVGWVATQLALRAGIQVIGTVSSANAARYAALGAIAVDYVGEDLEKRLRAAAPGIDRVLDSYGHGVLPVSIGLTGDADRVLTLADPTFAELGARISGGDEMSPIPVPMTAALPLIRSKRLTLPVEAAFPIADAVEAFRQIETGHRSGKIVIVL